ALIFDGDLDAALLVDAERRISAGHHPIAAELDRGALGNHQHADIISDGTLALRSRGGGAKRGQRRAERRHQNLAVFHHHSSLSIETVRSDDPLFIVAVELYLKKLLPA